MKKSLLIGLLSAVMLSVSTVSAGASLLNIEFQGTGTSVPYHGLYAGYYDVTIDGELDRLICDDVAHTIYPGDSWQAWEFTFSDMQNGAIGKFTGLEKYSQAGWLFGQMPAMIPLVQAQMQAAIWTIMAPSAGVPLDGLAERFFLQATDGSHNSFDWSNTMTVLTPSPLGSGQEFLRHTTPVPEPSAFILFGSGLGVITMTMAWKRSKENIGAKMAL